MNDQEMLHSQDWPLADPQNAQPHEPETQGTTEQRSREALERFVQDPAGFIKQLVEEEAVKHLARLKEEAELRGALNVFRKNNADFARFEPLILQEVVTLIHNDPDGHIDPWETLLEKALAVFKKKFEAMLKEGVLQPDMEAPNPPFVEGAANRSHTPMPPTFSRQQIAKMSLAEYLKNEAAIDEAMRNQRVV